MVAEKEVPDNTVFWSTVGVVIVFVVVLAAVMIARSGSTGQVIWAYQEPSKPFKINPLACLDVPPCGSETSFMCCAFEPVPGLGIKCTAPIQSYLAAKPECPQEMPYACGCPEKYQYRQSRPVPIR